MVTRMLTMLENRELPLPLSVYRNYKEVEPNNPDWEGTQQPSDLEPPFTSYSSFWCGPLDYIAVLSNQDQISQNDSCRLFPLQMLRVPQQSEIGPRSDIVNSKRIPETVELPNDVRGSDHLPIMVNFALLRNN